MGTVEDYGYAIVSPYCSAGGGAVILIRESAMEIMVKDTMDTYNSEAFKLIVASAFLIVLVIITYYLSDLIEKALRKKKYAAHDLDELTGLLSKQSAIVEIKGYSESGENKKGLLFMLELRDASETRNQKGDAFADEKIKEFANSLFGRYRSTDVVARYSDDRFLVFLKGIGDQKDIRKQTDEMQLFLHDSRFFDADRELTVNAGAAVYPDNGRNAPDIITAAERALERSKTIGKGILSF
jgi:diguanylate cyclase (GGDEF)-like protein